MNEVARKLINGIVPNLFKIFYIKSAKMFACVLMFPLKNDGNN